MTIDELVTLFKAELNRQKVPYGRLTAGQPNLVRIYNAGVIDLAALADAARDAQASQLLAMKGALEECREVFTALGYGAHTVTIAMIDALLPRSSADKIAEGLRDAIAIGGAPNSGGGDELGDGSDFGVTGEWWGTDTRPLTGGVTEEAGVALAKYVAAVGKHGGDSAKDGCQLCAAVDHFLAMSNASRGG
jgi:hypothetical protein